MPIFGAFSMHLAHLQMLLQCYYRRRRFSSSSRRSDRDRDRWEDRPGKTRWDTNECLAVNLKNIKLKWWAYAAVCLKWFAMGQLWLTGNIWAKRMKTHKRRRRRRRRGQSIHILYLPPMKLAPANLANTAWGATSQGGGHPLILIRQKQHWQWGRKNVQKLHLKGRDLSMARPQFWRNNWDWTWIINSRLTLCQVVVNY